MEFRFVSDRTGWAHLSAACLAMSCGLAIGQTQTAPITQSAPPVPIEAAGTQDLTAGNATSETPAHVFSPPAPDPWQAPAAYYAGVTATGPSVKSQLTSAMSAGHIQRAYGDFRSSARYHDADPNNSGNILLVYNGASVSATWDSGSTWNREHVWPQSLQSGSASNSTRGNLGDPHALRPCNPSINSSRSNKPFGLASTTGGFRSLGTYYFPGDTDKGDIARSIFYSATRYASQGLTLTNGPASFNNMGDLDSFMTWHYLDTPDEFERRRNHVIYSSAENPIYYTNNRNAFVDLPGAAWAVYRDNLNDSQLWVGSTPAPDGGSQLDFVDAGIAGAVPPSYAVSLQRSGDDGTYYAVEPTGDAATDQPLHNGFTGAFPIGDQASRSIEVGIDPAAITGPGIYSGTVVIDNLDMTDGLGAGYGHLDADDTVTITFESYAASIASLESGTPVDSTLVDVGPLALGTTYQASVPLYALADLAGPTAGAEFSLSQYLGAGSPSSVDLPAGPLSPGDQDVALLTFTTQQPGPLQVTALLETSDDASLLGAQSRGFLTITLAGYVALCQADVNADGIVDNGDIGAFIVHFLAQDPAADFTGDGIVDNGDINAFVVAFLAGC